MDSEDEMNTPMRGRKKISSPARLFPKSPVQRAHEKEVEIISELWEGTQDELRRTSREIKQIEETQKMMQERRDREHREEVSRLKNMIDDLRDQLTFTKAQLQKSGSEKISLEIQLKERDDKLRRAESMLEIKTSQLRTKETKIQELIEEAQNISVEKEDALNKSIHELKEQQNKLKSTEIELSLKESKIRQQEEDIKALSSINKKNVNMISELEDLRETRSVRRTSIGLTKSTLEERNDQLRMDNARLTKMLASTGAFREFFENASSYNGITFLPLNKMISDDELDGAPVTYGIDSPVNPKTEWKFWIPTEAVEIANGFMKNYLPDMNEGIFNELLHRLNYVWHKRERSIITKLKTQHLEELTEVRRQLTSQNLEEGAKSLEKIESLRNELRRAKSPAKSRDLETRLDSSLRELREVKREMRRTSLGTPNDEQFMEGAVWMGRKVNDIADRMGEQIASMAQDFQQKIIIDSSRPSTSPQKMVRTQGTFLKGIERSVHSFRDRIRKLFERVLQALDAGEDVTTVKFDTSSFLEDTNV